MMLSLMRTGAAFVLGLLAIPMACTTAGTDTVEMAFRSLDDVQRPFATRKARDFDHLPEGYEGIVSLLPVGHWGLLIDAFPDRAFARYAPRFEKGGDEAIVSRWALVRLAERGHRPTLDFFRGRLGAPDSYQRSLAVRMMAHAGDGSLTPQLLGMLPSRIVDGDDSMLAADLLAAAAGNLPSHPAAIEAALGRFAQDDGWIVSDSTRGRFSVTRAADPAAAAAHLLFEERKEGQELESFEAWLPEFAVRHQLTALAPVLRRRIRLEIETYRARGEEKALKPSESLLPQLDSFWGFRGPFLLAAYRQALRDLGVALEPEERDWLESQRMLRPALAYLKEAGVLPR